MRASSSPITAARPTSARFISPRVCCRPVERVRLWLSGRDNGTQERAGLEGGESMNRTIKLGAFLAFMSTLGLVITASASTAAGSSQSQNDRDTRTVQVIEHATTDTQVPSSPDQTGS